jgi:glycosyltransferase involved in cell wall biosynthesis
MKIAFVTTYNAKDIRNYSGTAYYMSKALIDAGIEVEFIGDLKEMSAKHLIFRFRNLLYNRILGHECGNYMSLYEPQNLKFIARQVEERVIIMDVDIIFSPGAIPIAYLNTKKPIVMWTDATFAVMQNYYSCLTGLNKKTIKNSHLYEKNILKRASLAIFSSEWAADSAIRDYRADPGKVKMIPYGANIECARNINDIVEINSKKSRNICKLLLIGKEWERKGADTAVKIAVELNKLGVETELTILGCTPPASSSLPDFIHVLGFVDKSNTEGESLITNLYSESHFFILPTIAECTPIVFSEANSFGLPVITTSTGGISSIIRNDINGKMFGTEIDIPYCAAYISEIFSNLDRYNEYSLSSFTEYMTRLNWSASITKCIGFLHELL